MIPVPSLQLVTRPDSYPYGTRCERYRARSPLGEPRDASLRLGCWCHRLYRPTGCAHALGPVHRRTGWLTRSEPGQIRVRISDYRRIPYVNANERSKQECIREVLCVLMSRASPGCEMRHRVDHRRRRTELEGDGKATASTASSVPRSPEPNPRANLVSRYANSVPPLMLSLREPCPAEPKSIFETPPSHSKKRLQGTL